MINDAAARARALDPLASFIVQAPAGSGKTECYFEGIAEALRLDRQVLVLLPEIALTENFLRRFEARFGVPPVLWHSSLKMSERRRAWRAPASSAAMCCQPIRRTSPAARADQPATCKTFRNSTA